MSRCIRTFCLLLSALTIGCEPAPDLANENPQTAPGPSETDAQEDEPTVHLQAGSEYTLEVFYATINGWDECQRTWSIEEIDTASDVCTGCAFTLATEFVLLENTCPSHVEWAIGAPGHFVAELGVQASPGLVLFRPSEDQDWVPWIDGQVLLSAGSFAGTYGWYDLNPDVSVLERLSLRWEDGS